MGINAESTSWLLWKNLSVMQILLELYLCNFLAYFELSLNFLYRIFGSPWCLKFCIIYFLHCIMLPTIYFQDVTCIYPLEVCAIFQYGCSIFNALTIFLKFSGCSFTVALCSCCMIFYFFPEDYHFYFIFLLIILLSLSLLCPFLKSFFVRVPICKLSLLFII